VEFSCTFELVLLVDELFDATELDDADCVVEVGEADERRS
jgi:hypothetical protein